MGVGWGGGTVGPDGLLSPQLSGLLQVCVRTGTETQAKFTSVELLRAYITVRAGGTRSPADSGARLILPHVKGSS